MKLIGGIPSFAVVLITVCLTFPTYGKASDAEANTLFVEAVQAISVAEGLEDPVEKLQAIDDALGQLDRIVTEHPSSNLAVSIITGQSIGNVDPGQLRKQRDILKSEVDDMLAQRAIEAEAKEGHARWVQEVMDCLDSFHCSEDRVFIEQQKRVGTVRALSQVGGAEAMRHGFSDRFDDFLNQMLQQFPDEEKLGQALPEIWYMISPAILKEEPTAVLEFFTEFETEYLPEVKNDYWQNGILVPAQVALLANKKDKFEGYIRALVQAGIYDDLKVARDEAFSQTFQASWSDIESVVKGNSIDNYYSSPTEGVLKYFAQSEGSEFEQYYDRLSADLQKEDPDFDPEAYFLDYRIIYLVASGSADQAVQLIFSTPEASRAGANYWKHWHWIESIAWAGFANQDRETQEALRTVFRVALENSEGEQLPDEALHSMLIVSHLLN